MHLLTSFLEKRNINLSDKKGAKEMPRDQLCCTKKNPVKLYHQL